MKDNWLREVDFFTGGGPSEASSGSSEDRKSAAATVQVSSFAQACVCNAATVHDDLHKLRFVGPAAARAHRRGTHGSCSGVCAGANRQPAAGQAAETPVSVPGAPAAGAGERQGVVMLSCRLLQL